MLSSSFKRVLVRIRSLFRNKTQAVQSKSPVHPMQSKLPVQPVKKAPFTEPNSAHKQATGSSYHYDNDISNPMNPLNPLSINPASPYYQARNQSLPVYEQCTGSTPSSSDSSSWISSDSGSSSSSSSSDSGGSCSSSD